MELCNTGMENQGHASSFGASLSLGRAWWRSSCWFLWWRRRGVRGRKPTHMQQLEAHQNRHWSGTCKAAPVCNVWNWTSDPCAWWWLLGLLEHRVASDAWLWDTQQSSLTGRELPTSFVRDFKLWSLSCHPTGRCCHWQMENWRHKLRRLYLFRTPYLWTPLHGRWQLHLISHKEEQEKTNKQTN